MKKVLIFSLAYYPHVGGAEVAIKEITDRIAPADIEFHLICLRYERTALQLEKIGNVQVHRIGFGNTSRFNKFYYQFAAAFKAYSLNRTKHFDALWAMMAHTAGVPAALTKLLLPRLPYLLVLQEGDPPEYIERLMLPLWPLFSRAFTSADAIVAESHFLGRWARRRGYRGEMEIIPNGVEAARFVGEPVPHDGVILITTSRLVRKNAIDDVIRALVLLPKTVSFLIIGTGPDIDDLMELTHELGVETRVEFLGHLDHAAIPTLLHGADIFIRPSRSEGMGNSFIEAMAAGLPIIATQEGGIADFLFDARRNPDKPTTGWAVDTDSPEQIAEAVKNILANPEQVAKVTATAKRLAIEKYDWNLIAAKMQAILVRVMNKP